MMCRSQSGRTRWGPGGRGKPPNVGVVGRWRDQPTVDDERVFHDTEREHQVRHRFVLNKCSRGMPDQPKHYPSPTTAGRLPGVVVVGQAENVVVLSNDGAQSGRCTGDSPVPQVSAPLPYGSLLTYGGYSCLSAETGVTCTEVAGSHGFTVNRASFTPR